jgi:hypothetical protein
MAAAEVGPLSAAMSWRDKIAAVLDAQGVLSVKQLTEEVSGQSTKSATETIRNALKRDHGKRFRTYSDGTWSLRDWRSPVIPTTRQSPPVMRLVETGEADPEELPF